MRVLQQPYPNPAVYCGTYILIADFQVFGTWGADTEFGSRFKYSIFFRITGEFVQRPSNNQDKSFIHGPKLQCLESQNSPALTHRA